MSVRVVDLSGPPADVAREVDAACVELGFVSIVGHGVDERVVQGAFDAARAFFDLPESVRRGCAPADPTAPYGYRPLRAEALERSLGTGVAIADVKESYNIGPIDPPPVPLSSMRDPDQRAVYAPNHWPDDVVPGFRPAMEAYYRSMAELSARLMSVFAMALGLAPGHFEPFIDQHGSALRIAHYPPLDAPPLPGQLRAGAHTDYGTLTVLATDGRPGLQVERTPGEWVDVDAPDGGFVVNLGDLMARWTDDRWRSTMHRVVVTDPATRRLSLPFFHNANWDAHIESLRTDGLPPRYGPVRAGAHLMAKFRSTVSDGAPR